ncbi:MAG: hypothetical protein MK171_02740 [Pirellulales bacterium]|nr:hypothetical protein [Pirellulales bacterium]
MNVKSLELDASDSATLEELVGYLNFSSGAGDPNFLRQINQIYRSVESRGEPTQSLPQLFQWLRETVERLEKAGGPFAKAEQARGVIGILADKLLPAYRQFHRDLLFHQSEAQLWRPFFIGQAFEAILAQGSPWGESDRIVSGALVELNDYFGYRPIATLATGDTTDPYPHEFVRPLPLYIRGAGVEYGRYEKIIQLTLDILQSTDEEILAHAWFDLDRLDEIAVDPRAYDFDHPVNRRPNYHFGQWDPRQISTAGYYRRFVLQQITLDALLSRCHEDNGSQGTPREDRLKEAASVLAGTMLMASGTSGDGPGRHDSTVSLSTLLPHIAGYRDNFYAQLLAGAEGSYGERLREEARHYHQPFGAARQHLNHELARRRALQMQRVHLAHLYARLSFPESAQEQAASVRVASARMLTEIYCRLTSGHDAIDADKLDRVVEPLAACEKLLYDAIECGALVDPWNVVGFAANFSLFPALENTVHDWRVDELIELVEQVLDLCARGWSEAAAIDNAELEEHFSTQLSRLAEWWDKFATASVEGVKRLVAKDIQVSANLVAGALNAWHKAGAAAGDVAFWHMFVDQFDSSKAFQLVIEALLDHDDTVASMALMMQWVSQKDRTPLEEGDNSFRRLAFRWLATVDEQQEDQEKDAWPQVAKFFAYLEANAEDYWQVPTMMFDADGEGIYGEFLDDVDGAIYFEEDEHDVGKDPDEDPDGEFKVGSDNGLEGGLDEDGEANSGGVRSGGLYQAAYEEMVYRDSTDDGNEGDIADEGGDWEYSEWEHEIERIEQRLDFLAAIASLWKHAAIGWGFSERGGKRSEVFNQWLKQATANYSHLVTLLETIHDFQISPTSGSHDSLVEYDRLRTLKESLVQKIIGTCVETADAARLLAATHEPGELQEAELLEDPINIRAVGILDAILRGDAAGVRSQWQEFLDALRPKSLLYVPNARGGEPRLIVATRSLQQLLYDLLGWLPQIGLIRETSQLLDLAQQLEAEHPVGQGAVTDFDRLFANGFQAIVRALASAAEQWDKVPASSQGQHADHMLVDALQQLTERHLDRWLHHSHTLRLSVVEKVAEDESWERLQAFIKRYGADLFDQKFMSFGNLRGILHQSVEGWLQSLEEDPDAFADIRLLDELGNRCSHKEAVESLTLAIGAVVENFRVYRDYNTTTTQSDHGDQLYTFIDFLRLQSAYDRVAWNLKPAVWVHEILIRQRRALAAEMWCQAFADRTSEAADVHSARLEQLCQKYGMRLATVTDRIGERFIRPLLIDRVKALVEPALSADEDCRQVAFADLEREIDGLASEPCGAGLDLPDWLAALEDEVTMARSRCSHQPSWNRFSHRIGQVNLSWQELLDQLDDPGEEIGSEPNGE